ncbi:MAG: hypothetical protein GY915_07495 [bacterium]|nr:hypothetical protein [bacterium]
MNKAYRDTQKEGRFIVSDSWDSEESYQTFRASFEGKYKALDQKCSAFFERGALIGHFSAKGTVL